MTTRSQREVERMIRFYGPDITNAVDRVVPANTPIVGRRAVTEVLMDLIDAVESVKNISIGNLEARLSTIEANLPVIEAATQGIRQRG